MSIQLVNNLLPQLSRICLGDWHNLN